MFAISERRYNDFYVKSKYLAVLKSWQVSTPPNYYSLKEWFDVDLGGLGGGICHTVLLP